MLYLGDCQLEEGRECKEGLHNLEQQLVAGLGGWQRHRGL